MLVCAIWLYVLFVENCIRISVFIEKTSSSKPLPRGAFYATITLNLYYLNLAYNRLFEGGGYGVGGISVCVCVCCFCCCCFYFFFLGGGWLKRVA